MGIPHLPHKRGFAGSGGEVHETGVGVYEYANISFIPQSSFIEIPGNYGFVRVFENSGPPRGLLQVSNGDVLCDRTSLVFHAIV